MGQKESKQFDEGVRNPRKREKDGGRAKLSGQAKVFVKWVNSCLKDSVEVTCFEDFQDGIGLCMLFEVLSGKELKKCRKNPRTPIERSNNLSIALTPINEYIKDAGIGLMYSPAQIASGDERQILGVLWVLITKFIIPEFDESMSRKRGLLAWVQRVTKDYDLNIKNFRASWKDGLAFNALLHQYNSSLVDYTSLTREDPKGNCKNAFAVASKLGIPKILDVEDLNDEKSVLLYVYLLYRRFNSPTDHKVVSLGSQKEKLKKDSEEPSSPSAPDFSEEDDKQEIQMMKPVSGKKEDPSAPDMVDDNSVY